MRKYNIFRRTGTEQL